MGGWVERLLCERLSSRSGRSGGGDVRILWCASGEWRSTENDIMYIIGIR